jgi:hypothetical protein
VPRHTEIRVERRGRLTLQSRRNERTDFAYHKQTRSRAWVHRKDTRSKEEERARRRAAAAFGPVDRWGTPPRHDVPDSSCSRRMMGMHARSGRQPRPTVIHLGTRAGYRRSKWPNRAPNGPPMSRLLPTRPLERPGISAKPPAPRAPSDPWTLAQSSTIGLPALSAALPAGVKPTKRGRPAPLTGCRRKGYRCREPCRSTGSLGNPCHEGTRHAVASCWERNELGESRLKAFIRTTPPSKAHGIMGGHESDRRHRHRQVALDDFSGSGLERAVRVIRSPSRIGCAQVPSVGPSFSPATRASG